MMMMSIQTTTTLLQMCWISVALGGQARMCDHHSTFRCVSIIITSYSKCLCFLLILHGSLWEPSVPWVAWEPPKLPMGFWERSERYVLLQFQLRPGSSCCCCCVW
jgi:hypothetical protein